jgi:hypothetical protein
MRIFASPHAQYVAIVRALQCKKPGCCAGDPDVSRSVNVHCPVHDDQTPSFTVTETDHRVLIDCKAGCGFEDASQALRLLDLWPDPPSTGLTLAQLAEAKQLPVDFLKTFGVYETRSGGMPAVGIPYYSKDGSELAVQLRLSLTGDRFRWAHGGPDVLYGLSKLPTILAMGYVIIAEGSSDVWAGWFHTFPVLGVPSAPVWKAEWAGLFPDTLKVFVWCEGDKASWQLIDRVTADIPETLVLMPESVKDLGELHLAHSTDSKAIKAAVAQLVAAAKPAAELSEERERARRQAEIKDALEKSAGLLDDPKALSRIEQIMRDRGFAGSIGPAMLLYLAVTSRVLGKLSNLLVKGPSAAGKNYAVDAALALFPPDAFYKLTASSERFLVYTEELFVHRFVVVTEAGALQRNGVGTQIMRSLLSEGIVRYGTVIKTDHGPPKAIEIIKQGPSGLITTSVGRLDEELTTRLIGVDVLDTEEQTKAVVAAIGRDDEEDPDPVDVSQFVAAQQWIGAQAPVRVVIPFGRVLSSLVPTNVVRARRDRTQLSIYIKASAAFHMKQRKRDARGRIIATIDEDYAIVYTHLKESYQEASGGLTQAQRQAVEALRDLIADRREGLKAKRKALDDAQDDLGDEAEGPGDDITVSYRQVAKALNIEKSSAWRRLEHPITLGFVVNLETEKGRQARLCLPKDAPELPVELPDPETLRAAWETSKKNASSFIASKTTATLQHPPSPSAETQAGQASPNDGPLQSGVAGVAVDEDAATVQPTPERAIKGEAATTATAATPHCNTSIDGNSRKTGATDDGAGTVAVLQSFCEVEGVGVPSDQAAADLIRVLVLAKEAGYPLSTDLGLPPPAFSGKDGWEDAVEIASPDGLIDLGKRLAGFIRPPKALAGPAESGIPPGGDADIAVLVPSASTSQSTSGIPGEIDELI